MKLYSIPLILRPSRIEGVEVFTISPIKKGAKIPLFVGEDSKVVTESSWKKIKRLGLKEYGKYHVAHKGKHYGPLNAHRMSIGWYLNHSSKPNVQVDSFVALRDIKKGEELTIDYDLLEGRGT